MSDAIFLTDEEVCQLTGIRRGNGKKNYRELQVEWMIRRGTLHDLMPQAGRSLCAARLKERARSLNHRRKSGHHMRGDNDGAQANTQ